MRMFPLFFLFISSLSWATPNDGSPIFQSQLLNTAGTTVVDPLARDWTLNSTTDSVASITNDLVLSGTLTSGASTVSMSLNSQASLNVEISGTWVGVITVVEPGVAVTGHQLYVQSMGSAQLAATITANGNYRVAGLPTAATVVVSFTSYTSGTATVNMRASVAPYFMQNYQLNAFNLLTNSWLSDGSGNLLGSNNSSLNVNTKTPITANAPASVAVGTTSTSLLASNSARKGLVVVNNSAGVVSIGIGAAAVAGSGITLYPGGVWNMNENSFTTSAINAVSTLTASSVSAQEFQ